MNKETVFYQTLVNEDVQVRVEAVRSLVSFAKGIGAQRTTDELLPYLKGRLEDDDEVLLVLSEELGGLIELLGESTGLLALLSSLSQAEDEAVRQKATNTLLAFSAKFPSASFSASYISLVTNLGATPWFTSKMSCCALLPSAIARATEDQKPNLVSLYLTLAKDSTPMTRRAAASNMKSFLVHLSHATIMADFIEAFQTIAKDEQDSVRLLAIDIGAALAHSFAKNNKPELTTTIVHPVVLACAADKSWRVRYQLASSFVTLAVEVNPSLMQELLSVFVNLLQDSEHEVRSAAAGKISGVAKLVSKEDVITHLLPCLSLLVRDQSYLVRAAFAKDVMVLAPSFGQAGTRDHLLSIFLQLLKDEVPEVRLNVISKLDQVTPVIGLDQLSEHLIPAIIELGEDKAWRVRSAVISDIPPLAAQLSLEFFFNSLGDLCFSWLRDTVFAIRQAAIANLKHLTVIYGEPFSKIVLPKIANLCKNPNYLHRMTILFYAQHVGPLMSQAFFRENMVPLLTTCAKDPVANIRYATANALQAVLSHHTIEPQTSTELKTLVELLMTDSDPDVNDAATSANKFVQ